MKKKKQGKRTRSLKIVEVEDVFSGNFTMTTKQARRYHKSISALEKRLGRCATVVEIIAEAQKKTSPLHDWFEWGIKIAARKYWEVQARALTSTIKMTFIHPVTLGRVKSRAFTNVVEVHAGRRVRGYASTLRVHNDGLLLLNSVIDKITWLKQWCSGAEQHPELDPIRKMLLNLIPRVEKSLPRIKSKSAS